MDRSLARQLSMMPDSAARQSSRWLCNGMTSQRDDIDRNQARRSDYRVLRATDHNLTHLIPKALVLQLPGARPACGKCLRRAVSALPGQAAASRFEAAELTKCAQNLGCKSLSRDVGWQKLHRRAARKRLPQATGLSHSHERHQFRTNYVRCHRSVAAPRGTLFACRLALQAFF
jgi:hypothetical protein